MHLRMINRIMATVSTAFLFSALAVAQVPSVLNTQSVQSESRQQVPATQLQIPADSPFAGSVAEGKATGEVLRLSILDAIDLGLKHNLGLLLGDQGTRAARGARLVALSDLLPHLNARAAESSQQINLAAFGFPAQPGVPTVVGPFRVFDARATLGQSIFDLNALNNTRAANENVHGAELTLQDARERVVVVIANEYMELLTSQSRLEAAQAQMNTADAIFKQAQDLKKNGVAAGIDVLRAQVQSQLRSQQLIAAENEVGKAKLALSRSIGLPAGQAFEATNKMPVALPQPVPLEVALQHAYENRNDLKRAESAVRAAELQKKAAMAKALPSVRFDGDYGDIGRSPSTSHGTYSATVSVKVPIFQGGHIKGEVDEADALLNQRRAELADLKGKVDAEVRTNFMDLESAIKQFQAAQTSLQLADQQLAQSRDRFAAGVSGSLEVTQSQEALANANESYITSVYALNLAQAKLAFVVGEAEQKIRQFLGENK